MKLTSVRWLSFGSLVALSLACSIGCSISSGEEFEGEDDLSVDNTDQAIVDVKNTPVKRQSIGNCWLYATASWSESINLAATGSAFNVSESYWTYWHWFDELTRGYVSTEVETGGSYEVASEIIKNYGLMAEADFIPEEANAEMSARQASALAAINASVKSGALKDPSARRDRALVRRELDKAWGLKPTVTAELDKVFGTDVSKNLRSSRTYTAGTHVVRPTNFKVKYKNGSTGSTRTTTLRTAVDEWKSVSYPNWGATTRRDFQIRFQKALNDAQPVIVSWFVDFNAMSRQGTFDAPPATPGRQGGHMTVMEDYAIDAVPGFGALEAGTIANDAQKKAALDPAAKIRFIRIKNSWGAYRPDRWDTSTMPGFHDLYMKYLDGPVKHCPEGQTTGCWDDVPLNDVVLPPGY
jgi:hypothetical protein